MPRNATAFEVQSDSPDAHKPGAYSFLRAPAGLASCPEGTVVGIVHACPCGCGGKTALYFEASKTYWAPGSEKPIWSVSGEWPKVTLSPSIGVKYDGQGNGPMTNPYHWHGFLRNGVFEEC